MRIERKKLADLTPAEYNPRQITSKAFSGLESSVGRYGLVVPIVWNERTGNIVGGHQRFRVLTANNIEETDVVVVDMPEKEEIALNITLNNPHIRGEFTDDAVDELESVSVYLDDAFAALRLDKLEDYLRSLRSVPPTEEDENSQSNKDKNKDKDKKNKDGSGRDIVACAECGCVWEKKTRRILKEGDSYEQITDIGIVTAQSLEDSANGLEDTDSG